MPSTSYPPEFFEIMKRGAVEPLQITLPSWRQGAHLRHRLNNLRKDMRKENHPMLSIAEAVQFSLEPTIVKKIDPRYEEPAVLTARPSDTGDNLLENIRAAGITVTDDPALADMRGAMQSALDTFRESEPEPED